MSFAIDGSIDNEDSDRSVLAAIGRSIAPAFAPMGLQEDNWPAAVGIFTGILAKEAVVGTLDAAYTALAASGAEENSGRPPFDLAAGLREAFTTIPANLSNALASWSDPLGLNVGDVNDPTAVTEKQALSTSTFGAMASRFEGAAGAFAYLLFILLYFPCASAIAAVYQEAGGRWTMFVACWTTGLGYGISTLYYQAATWNQHPATSLAWITAILLAFGATLVAMRWVGHSVPDNLSLR